MNWSGRGDFPFTCVRADTHKMLSLAELGRAVNDANITNISGAEGEAILGEAAAGVLVEEEDEEHTQIQSSLPFYFDHMFGTRMGGSSQSEGNGLSPVTSPLQGPSRVPICSNTKAVSVLESHPSPTQCCEGVQTVEDSVESALAVGEAATTTRHVSPPSSSASPPSTSPTVRHVTCVSEDSPVLSAVLFSSPDTSACNCGDSRPAGDMARTGEEGDPGHGGELPVLSMACRKRARMSPREAESRPKKQKQSSVAAEDGYCCPPCCTVLARCSDVGSNVNVLAVVVQG